MVESLYKSSFLSEKKVLIIDEVHELSPKAKSELLKPLENENLKDKVLYIACTTEFSALPNMFVERFLDFRVSPINEKESLDLIDSICEKEKLYIEKSLKALLIEKGEGIPRRLLTGLAKIREVKTEEEASYLLNINAIEEDADILDLFKLILNKASWNSIKKCLSDLLKTKKPDTIRIGLMNILSGRIMSNYFSITNEGQNSIYMYNILRNSSGFPEKANLISAILHISLKMKG